MSCTSPMQGFRSRFPNLQGKYPFVPDRRLGDWLRPLKLPCGYCLSCRLDYAKSWTVRMVHESHFYSVGSFITLTYSNEFLPSDGSLHLEDFQLFMKRLRKRFGSGIRFFHSGEYGDLNGRPHYHAILFGVDFHDRYFWSDRNGFRLYRSPILESLWPFGFCSVGSVTVNSCNYVARYILPKVTGKDSELNYLSIDMASGEVLLRKPEYSTMSRMPGLGQRFFNEFCEDIYVKDEVRLLGNPRPFKVPRYYDSLLEKKDPLRMERIRGLRVESARDRMDDNTPARLKVKSIIQQSKANRLVRTLRPDEEAEQFLHLAHLITDENRLEYLHDFESIYNV